MNNQRIDGVIIVIALVFCGLLIWQYPPEQQHLPKMKYEPLTTIKRLEQRESKLFRDPVTGVEVSGRAVIMISKQGCAPCEQLKRETLPEAREAGYETTIVEQPAERYPTCRIFDGRRWQTRVGFFRWSNPLRAEVKKYIENNAGSSPPKSWYRNGDPWRNLTAEEANKTFERVSE